MNKEEEKKLLKEDDSEIKMDTVEEAKASTAVAEKEEVEKETAASENKVEESSTNHAENQHEVSQEITPQARNNIPRCRPIRRKMNPRGNPRSRYEPRALFNAVFFQNNAVPHVLEICGNMRLILETEFIVWWGLNFIIN